MVDQKRGPGPELPSAPRHAQRVDDDFDTDVVGDYPPDHAGRFEALVKVVRVDGCFQRSRLWRERSVRLRTPHFL